jgi:hypothetical protein
VPRGEFASWVVSGSRLLKDIERQARFFARIRDQAYLRLKAAPLQAVGQTRSRNGPTFEDEDDDEYELREPMLSHRLALSTMIVGRANTEWRMTRSLKGKAARQTEA